MMGKTSDILKELEDIGALGNKIPEVTIRRPAPILALSTFEPEPKLSLVPETHEVLVGFAEQLETLEGALQGMLEWCATARQALLGQDNPEEVQEAPSDAVEEEDQGNETKSLAQEDSVVTSTVAVALKPKLSLAEIRKHFLDPEFQVAEVPINGAAPLETPIAPTTETEKPNE